MLPDKIQGNYWVSPTPTVIRRGWDLCDGKARGYQLLRRHGMKLAHWPKMDDGSAGAGADIDWDWIKTLERFRIGELRIDEVINGFDNLRVIFFKANIPLPDEKVNRIWLLTVFQKKRKHFTSAQLKIFKAARNLIVERFYGGSDRA